jgi:hypothetical protein
MWSFKNYFWLICLFLILKMDNEFYNMQFPDHYVFKALKSEVTGYCCHMKE